jgi:hypothetical protein
VEPLDLRQLSRFLISEMQRLVGLSVEAIALTAALESVNRWISGAGSSAAKIQDRPFRIPWSSAEKMLDFGVRRHDWEMFRSGMKTEQLEVGGGG